MISLRDLFKTQAGFFGRWKGAHVVSNFLQAKKLVHNKALYKKYGVAKSIYAPIGSQDFNYSLAGEIPWLNMPGIAGSLAQNTDFQQFEEETQAAIRRFITDGLLVLRGFFSDEKLAALVTAAGELGSEKKAGQMQGEQNIQSAGQHAAAIDSAFKNDKLMNLLGFLMGKTAIPFQSNIYKLAFEQRAHADHIYFTTQPPGYHISTWTALEEMDASSGQFFYYPGSQYLPYLTMQDFDSGNSTFFLGKNSAQKYEEKVTEVIAENSLEKHHLHLQKGDVLIWHTNLLHGWEPPAAPNTRQNGLLAHYFGEGAICYHDILQRPARMEIEN